MNVLAIDPGNEMSGWCLVRGSDYKPLQFGKTRNFELLTLILNYLEFDDLAIEMIASYGMPVGKDVFETCVWIGRFIEAAELTSENEINIAKIYRMDEKKHLCRDSRAKDANIRKALIDRFAKRDFVNGKGTKERPDWFYGFKADIWSAYAVAVTHLDVRSGK